MLSQHPRGPQRHQGPARQSDEDVLEIDWAHWSNPLCSEDCLFLFILFANMHSPQSLYPILLKIILFIIYPVLWILPKSHDRGS